MKTRRGYADGVELLGMVVFTLIAAILGCVTGCEQGKMDGARSHYKGDLIVVPLPDGTLGVYTKEQIAAAKDRNGGAK